MARKRKGRKKGMGVGMAPARVGSGPVRAQAAARCRVAAADLVRGALRLEELPHGWVRPWRFVPRQVRALESCMAWYPGIFRQMAGTTAGVRLEFETDSATVTLELRVDAEPRATRKVLAGVTRPAGGVAHDALSADVDGHHLVLPLAELEAVEDDEALPADEALARPGERAAHVTLDLTATAAPRDLLQLPGMGSAHHVRVWLPSLRGCELGYVEGDGTYMRPAAYVEVPEAEGQGAEVPAGEGASKSGGPAAVSSDAAVSASMGVSAGADGAARRPGAASGAAGMAKGPAPDGRATGSDGAWEPSEGDLLVLGDSVAQGFVTDDPALAWPSLVARDLGRGLVNQGLGAQVFQPTALGGLEHIDAPAIVVVALGENYRFGRCIERVVGREIQEFLSSVDRLWPDAGLVVLVPAPLGRREAVRGSCYEQVPLLVREAARRVRKRRVSERRAPVAIVEGPRLRKAQLADADGHPTAAGAALVADVVREGVGQLGCRCLRDLGTYGACGACVHSVAGAQSLPTGSAKPKAADASAARPHGSSEAPAESADDAQVVGGPGAAPTLRLI